MGNIDCLDEIGRCRLFVSAAVPGLIGDGQIDIIPAVGIRFFED